MAGRSGGLDFIDLLIQTGITMAMMVAVGGASRENPEALMGLVVAASLGILAFRRARALRHAPPVTTGEVQAERVLALEDRIAELEAQQVRMHELEERVDFAERLLAQQRDPARLPAGGER